MSIEFKFGADPELFVINSSTKQPVSAFGFLEGTKEKPMVVEGGALQVDGMALEFNVNPFSDVEDAFSKFRAVVEQLKMFVPEGHKLVADPLAEFGSAYIESQPDAAKELGCDPDFNAYLDGAINPSPKAKTPFRTGSGHVHIGWTDKANPMSKEHLEACVWVTKQLDYALAIPALLFGDPARMKARRNLYGRAGAFRPKTYGVEYRVLDNYWMRSKKHINWVFSQTQYAVDCLNRGFHFFDKYYAGIPEEEIQRIINECDVAAAKEVIADSYVLQKFELPKIYTGTLLK